MLTQQVRTVITASLIAIFSGYAHTVAADNSIKIGPELNILTQVQGNWANDCRRTGLKLSEGYRRDFLTINYTHFEFLAKIYNDESCKHLVTQWPSKFRFNLGDSVLLPNKEKALLLNLFEESDPADAWSLSPNNILYYKAGRIALGRESPLGSGSNQLTSLDSEQFYSRR